MQSVNLTNRAKRGIERTSVGFTQTHSKHNSPKHRRQKKRAHVIPEKYWPTTFHTPRAVSAGFFLGEQLKRFRANEALSEDDAVMKEIKEQMGGSAQIVTDEDLLDLLVEELEGSIPSWEARTVRAMFSREAKQNGSIPDAEPWAWLDDREFASGNNRATQVLDCPSLRQALRHEVSRIHESPGSHMVINSLSGLDMASCQMLIGDWCESQAHTDSLIC